MKNKSSPSDLSEDNADIKRYSDQAEKFGYSVKTLGWSSQITQDLRFSILSQIGIENESSVLDVGCGFGDLLPWLRRGGYQGEYTGVDLTPALIEIAQDRHKDSNFIIGNILTEEIFEEKQFDYVLASGIFTYRTRGGLDYVQRMVEQMFALSRTGCAFNCLSGWGELQVHDELLIDPFTISGMCRAISPWIVLRHDYHPGDFTLYLYKSRQDPNS